MEVGAVDNADHTLRAWFERIDATELSAMQSRRDEESYNLDFKRMSVSGEPDDNDKRNLRTAISGYANAAGGIILWGVESKSAADKADRSRFHAIVPIADGDRAAVRFHELTANATQPAVNGVLHRAIEVDGGFVVKTFVPASDGGPHRTNEEKGQYYRRDADAFRAMQHHEIADMFGRRPRPLLELVAQGAFGAAKPKNAGTVRIISLKNTGRGIARFPCLVLHRDPSLEIAEFYGLDDSGTTGLSSKLISATGVESRMFAGDGNSVIHAGQVLPITRVGLNLGKWTSRLNFEIFAENMDRVAGSFRLWNPDGIEFEPSSTNR